MVNWLTSSLICWYCKYVKYGKIKITLEMNVEKAFTQYWATFSNIVLILAILNQWFRQCLFVTKHCNPILTKVWNSILTDYRNLILTIGIQYWQVWKPILVEYWNPTLTEYWNPILNKYWKCSQFSISPILTLMYSQFSVNIQPIFV